MDLALELELVGRLMLAAVLGFAIGLEREWTDKPAGERTHALTCLGAAAFAVISIKAFPGGDISRVAAGVVTGLGFLGAGMILKTEGGEVHGLTTAAGIWTVGAIGLAVGAGMYFLGVAASLLAGLILVSDRFLRTDARLRRIRAQKAASYAESQDTAKSLETLDQRQVDDPLGEGGDSLQQG